MKLYNTRTKTIDDVQPLADNTIRIYSCGPTVYDHAHIGNISAYIFADTLRRTLQVLGYETIHGMNYTDVDDKTIRRSHERFPDDEPHIALGKLTDEYITLFLRDMDAVGNDTSALSFMRATDPNVMAGMQELIRKLHEEGFAYIADDGAYFSIDTYRKSGKTYGQLLELTMANTSEERIQNDEYDKESIHDFALWKKQKGNEPAWPFMLDGHDLTGRPGWHIECSVMSQQLLGQPFDVHTGGVDLIFPHHENEIAQSTAGKSNTVMASVFAHNEHILVDGRKMAKSANNFYTLQDIQEHGFNPLAFRLLVLQSHYRSQVHFSWDNLTAAQNRLLRFQNFAALQHQLKAIETDNTAASMEPADTPTMTLVAALSKDLDTPHALREVEAYMDTIEKANVATSTVLLTQLLTTLDQLFGLQLMEVPDISSAHKRLIADREQVRAVQDWAESDRLRDQLQEEGIGVRDTTAGTVWYRTQPKI